MAARQRASHRREQTLDLARRQQHRRAGGGEEPHEPHAFA
jgi:hypothetical protein